MNSPDTDQTILATAKGTSFLAGGSFFEFAARFFIALLLARNLGAADYGLYVLSISAASIFAGISLLGLDDAMVRYVAILSGRRDRDGVWGTMQIGLGVSVLAGTLMGAVLFIAAQPIAQGLFQEPRLTPLLRLFAFVVPFLTVSNVLAGTARGFRRMDYSAFAENVVMSLVRLVLVAILSLVNGLSLYTAGVIFGISDVAASVTLIILVNKVFPLGEAFHHVPRRDLRAVFGFALPLWLSGLLRQFRRNIQTFILGTMAAASSIGVFAVASNVTLVGHVWLLSILVAVKPILAQLHDRRDQEGLAHLYATSTRWTLALNVPFFLLLVLYPHAILSIFGETFVAGTTVLVILAFAELMNAGTGICGPMLDMTGHTRVKLANTVLWTLLLIGGDALLIPRWGVVGAATASLIAIGAVNVLTVAEVWILEGLLPYDRTFWKPVIAGLAALIAGLALQTWIPVGTHVLRAVGEGAVVAAVYGGLTLLLGLPPEDRLVIRRAWGRAVRVFAGARPTSPARERST